ncbi:MAG: phosphatase PAP2 family protein [Burkholderiales bacterium]
MSGHADRYHYLTIPISLASIAAIALIGAHWICHGASCTAHSLDARVLHWFASNRSPLLDDLLSIFTWLGSLAVLLPLAAFAILCLIRLQRHREAIFVGAALVGISALTHWMKWAVARPRPNWHEAVVAMPIDLSFPSAHAAQITAFVIALVVVLKHLRMPRLEHIAAFGAILILIVSVSRLYLQVHFPSDVLAGCLAAALWVAALAHLLPVRHDAPRGVAND